VSDQQLDPSLPRTRQPPARDGSLERPVRKKDLLWAVIVLAALTAGGIQVERTRIHDPWLADHEVFIFFLMYLGWLFGATVMIAVHEFAHALVAWAVGITVNGVSLGCGPRLCRIHLRKIFLDLHAFPVMGVCWTLPLAPTQHPWRRALMIAAGPATHILALLAVTGLWFAEGWNRQEHFTIPSALAVGFFICNLVALPLNLLPRNTNWNGMPTRADGGSLLDLLRGNPATQSQELLIFLGNQGKWDEVQQISRAMLRQQPPQAPSTLFVVHAWLAVADIWVGGEEDLTEADTISQRCMATAPADSAILTVRACVLLALHRDTEAEKLLTLAQFATPGPHAEKAAAHLWTELHRRRNNLPEMQRWQSIAQKLDPTAAYKLLRNPPAISVPSEITPA